MKEKMSRSKIKVYIVLHLLLFLYRSRRNLLEAGCKGSIFIT